MTIRVVFLVLAIFVFSGWLRIVGIAAAVVLPWIAVVLANAGPTGSDDDPTFVTPDRVAIDGPPTTQLGPANERPGDAMSTTTFDTEWATAVRTLATQRNAVILAHNYMLPEIQDVADHVGDSLALVTHRRDERGRHDRVLRRAFHGRDREDSCAEARRC